MEKHHQTWTNPHFLANTPPGERLNQFTSAQNWGYIFHFGASVQTSGLKPSQRTSQKSSNIFPNCLFSKTHLFFPSFRDHKALKVPLLPQDLRHEPPVPRGRHPGDVVEGAHQRQGPGLQGGTEGRQMHVPQRGFTDLHEVVLHAWLQKGPQGMIWHEKNWLFCKVGEMMIYGLMFGENDDQDKRWSCGCLEQMSLVYPNKINDLWLFKWFQCLYELYGWCLETTHSPTCPNNALTYASFLNQCQTEFKFGKKWGCKIQTCWMKTWHNIANLPIYIYIYICIYIYIDRNIHSILLYSVYCHTNSCNKCKVKNRVHKISAIPAFLANPKRASFSPPPQKLDVSSVKEPAETPPYAAKCLGVASKLSAAFLVAWSVTHLERGRNWTDVLLDPLGCFVKPTFYQPLHWCVVRPWATTSQTSVNSG